MLRTSGLPPPCVFMSFLCELSKAWLWLSTGCSVPLIMRSTYWTLACFKKLDYLSLWLSIWGKKLVVLKDMTSQLSHGYTERCKFVFKH